MKTFTAIDIHSLATESVHRYWRDCDNLETARSMPDCIADDFGTIILDLQEQLVECRRLLRKHGANRFHECPECGNFSDEGCDHNCPWKKAMGDA